MAAATRAAPGDPRLWADLGLVRAGAGDAAGAAEAFGHAVSLVPADPEHRNSLGVMLRRLGRLADAEHQFRRAVETAPGFVGASYNLGNLLLESGRPAEAAALYRRVLGAAPDHRDARLNLGVAEKALGNLGAATAAFERVLAARPDHPGALVNLGNLRREQNRPEDALRLFERAAAAAPDSADVHYGLGGALKDLGRTGEAVARFAGAAVAAPGLVKARWAAALTLPPLYDSEDDIEAWRRRWSEGLARLEADIDLSTPAAATAAAGALAEWTNFLLPYQGRDDTALQRRYGALVHRIAVAAFPAFAEPPPRRRDRMRVRVGFVSAHFRDHTVLRLFEGWITGLDRTRFEVHLFPTAPGADSAPAAIIADSAPAAIIADSAPAAVAGRVDGIRAAAPESIRAVAPDVLVYLDIGMDPRTQVLAALPLAPAQVVTWGHPVTTGLPTIGSFLSSALMEPADGERHYSETLVRLPRLSIDYRRPSVPPPGGEGGRADGAPVYLCTQSLYKMLPAFDAAVARLAEEVPGARFRFVGHRNPALTARFRARLGRAFAARGQDAGRRVEMLAFMDRPSFLALHAEADGLLDTFGWSGGNTTLEAVACGLVPVTLPGPMMRGRHTLAILRRAGVEDTVAGDRDSWVATAARLGTDRAWRAELTERLRAGADRVFGDSEAVRALESVLERA